MNQQVKKFIKTSLLGGIIVILPSAILVVTFGWLFKKVSNALEPVTVVLFGTNSFWADLLSITIIVLLCFILGVVVKTKPGKIAHKKFEQYLIRKAPGYRTIKQILDQFLGREKTPFTSVALAQIYQNETLVTAFITEEHADGKVTVFVPTGPNPTSGNIFHLDKKYVHKLDVSVERTMQTIISCGAGSSDIINNKI